MYLVVYEGRRTRHMSFSMESADHAYALAVAYVAKNPGQYDKMFLTLVKRRRVVLRSISAQGGIPRGGPSG